MIASLAFTVGSHSAVFYVPNPPFYALGEVLSYNFGTKCLSIIPHA